VAGAANTSKRAMQQTMIMMLLLPLIMARKEEYAERDVFLFIIMFVIFMPANERERTRERQEIFAECPINLVLFVTASHWGGFWM
jgi:hypothetical protein